MDLEGFFVWQQMIERSVQSVVIDRRFCDSEQIRQRRFRKPLLGDVKLARWLQQAGDDQDQRRDIPWHMFASFRNHLVQKRVEMQRAKEMQRQPRTTELPQVLDSHATGIDLHPAWFSGSNSIIKFKPHLPPEWLHSLSCRDWFDRLPRDVSCLLNTQSSGFVKLPQPSDYSLPRGQWQCDAIPPAPSQRDAFHFSFCSIGA